MALPWVETVEFQSDSKVLDRGHPLPPSFFENCSFRALDGLLFAQHEAAYKKNFRGRFSVVRLHSSAPGSGSLRNPWCMAAASSFRRASELGEGP